MMITPAVITDAVKEPISVEEFKAHAKIEYSDEDSLIAQYIGSARRFFEKHTGRTVHEETREWCLETWPAGPILLPRATPLIEIVWVKYKDSSGLQTTWSSSDYLADTDSLPGRLVLAHSAVYPDFTPYPVSPIRIRYRCGIATTSPVTEADDHVKHVNYLLTAHFFENREPLSASASGAPLKPIPFQLWDMIEELKVEHAY